LIARADATGLGIQTHEFYKHMEPDKVLVVNLEHCNGRKTNPGLYPGCQVLEYTPYPETDLHREPNPDTRRKIDNFLNNIDVLFTCETPYDYYLFTEARARGVKTVLQYNFELLDYQLDPRLPKPDLLVAPSLWRFNDVKIRNKVFLPVPVNEDLFPRRSWDKPVVDNWIHIGGNPAMEDRNGTRTVIAAWGQVPNARLTITTPSPSFKSNHRNVSFMRGVYENYWELYPEHVDAFIMPRKFGGLCLPLNEALSMGMPTVMSDLDPQKDFLVHEGLIPATFTKSVMTKTMIDVYDVNHQEVARMVNRLAEDDELVADMRERSEYLAARISWQNLKPLYERTFQAVLDGEVNVPQMFDWGV